MDFKSTWISRRPLTWSATHTFWRDWNPTGIRGYLLRWFGSYLKNRRVIVRFASSQSPTTERSSGVPQCSHPQAIYFSLLLSVILWEGGGELGVNQIMFADDVQIFTKIRNDTDQSALQKLLQRVVARCGNKGMSLNVGNCVHISFYKGRSRLNALPQWLQTNGKDIGIAMQSCLSFSGLVKANTPKNDQTVVFRSSLYLSQPSSLKMFYCTYGRGILEYASIVWSLYMITAVSCLQPVQD